MRLDSDLLVYVWSGLADEGWNHSAKLYGAHRDAHVNHVRDAIRYGALLSFDLLAKLVTSSSDPVHANLQTSSMWPSSKGSNS